LAACAAADHHRAPALLKLAPVDEKTFALAADAMEQLALHQPESHRLPVTDLVTAAIAHQREMGVVHCDGDYELLAQHSGLTFTQRKIAVPRCGGAAGPV
jgi:predicted nucleic acid-binding protein